MRNLFEPTLPSPPAGVVQWGQLYGSAAALALAEATTPAPGPLLVVAADARAAERLVDELHFYGGAGLPVALFPDWETLPYDLFSPHADILSERLAVLAQLPDLARGLVVITPTALMQRLPPPAWVLGNSLLLKTGEALDLNVMRERLTAAGYASVTQVMEHGEFAVRGALLDVFPMGSATPLRIDLLDRDIETIRRFDPETQLSGEKLADVRLLPAREFPLDADGIRSFRQRYRARFDGDPQKNSIYREVSNGLAPGGVEYYAPLFFDQHADFFAYLPPPANVALMEGAAAGFEQAWAQIGERHEQHRHDLERPLLRPEELWLPPDEIRTALATRARIQVQGFEFPADSGTNFHTGAPPELRVDVRAAEPAAGLIEFVQAFPGRVLFAAESAGRREYLAELLAQHELRPAAVDGWAGFLASREHLAVCVAPLERGLYLPEAGVAVIAEEQLFGVRAHQARHRVRQRDPANIIRDLTALAAGAPVVHEEHGVGRYRGLQTLTLDGVETEFLVLEYAEGAKLYVPVSSLQLMSRYTGGAPETAPLHRLGSGEWEKARKRAAEQVRDVAAELLDLYAHRAARTGHAFHFGEREYRAFAEGFPYDETPDQQQVIDGVLADMRAGRAMDRVICGDVGFGKTEVALRAAFAAVQDGKQVALLVPTTLLAQQHYQTFRDRFAAWPVRIEVLSRFRSGKQQNQVVQGLADGSVDIVIGTHALLRDELKFKELGLVIVDEEHRFGVRHKEKLKKLRAEVDLLTLTATPIPRTLNMSLAGLRDLSIIATPPEERLAVKTFVSEWNDALVREACLREIKRGGQVYFVHNDVRTIAHTAAQLAKLMPEAE
ncbi:MAG: transcription-repair coupling factor, partial [Gammaproteobacteria bacterium]